RNFNHAHSVGEPNRHDFCEVNWTAISDHVLGCEARRTAVIKPITVTKVTDVPTDHCTYSDIANDADQRPTDGPSCDSAARNIFRYDCNVGAVVRNNLDATRKFFG